MSTMRQGKPWGITDEARTMTHRGICNRCGANVGFTPLPGHPEDKPILAVESATVIWARVALDLPPLPRLIMWQCPACDWQN